MTTKFKVLLQQYVEQICVVEVEAASPEEAASKAKSGIYGDLPAPEWKDGDDAYDVRAYGVQDESGALVWEA